ncbi:helix-turn-helix transcriptional regulator [Nocardia sp. NPDC056064]|uniref:AraC family transcriptional regulator n=1 Tax=Nocardia sp. NPDC056064 TaxID=3345701 RepID=UPI0035DD565D
MDEVVVGGETVSTAVVPPREAFGMWEAILQEHMTSCSIEPIGTDPFHATMTPLLYSAAISTARVRTAAEVARRTGRHISRSNPTSVVAVIPLAGHCEALVDGRRWSTPVGSMYIIDDRHPQELRNSDQLTSLMIRADRDLVMAASGLGEDQFPGAVVLEPAGRAALVIDYFRRLSTLPTSEAAAPALLRAGIDLLGAGIALGLGARPGDEAARTVALERVFAFLGEHLENPDLDVDAIAGGCRMSRRQLHRILAEPWGGPMKLLRHLRIEHARELLLNYPDKTVAAIARASGFSGDRSFYRAFRAETGLSPAEFRERALTTPSHPEMPS